MLSSHEISYTQNFESFERFLENDLHKDLLRFTTAGSVDDGKSTMIGRLLHDSKAVYDDQLAAVRRSRVNRSGKAIDFSLLTDGLRAEREQGITIDVAYRYFSTPRRKFIIADTPGHEQYTRNMATGASTAELAIILIDATKGLLPQTRRHTYIASLLGIRHAVAAINKMDLAGYAEHAFLPLQRQFSDLAHSLRIPFVQSTPISALEGDNVVARSGNMPWYTGPTLIEHLESLEIRPAHTTNEFRFPIQYVIRPDANFRGFAGRVASGVVRPGDAVVALPSRRATRVEAIVSYNGELEAAASPQSVVLRLADEIDLSRGDLLVSADAPPYSSNRFAAMLVWLEAQPLDLTRTYLLKHAGRVVKGRARRIRYGMNVDELAEEPAERLEMNGIASVEFETNSPVFFDLYRHNRTMGSFILIDSLSNATVGAGMIVESISQEPEDHSVRDVTSPIPASSAVSLHERAQRQGHSPGLFFVGPHSAFADFLEKKLFEMNFETVRVRGEAIPHGALPAVLSALWSTGSLIVYSDHIAPQKQAACESVAGQSFFDLSTTPTGIEHDSLRRALEFAEMLRIPSHSERKEMD